ncbi:MAG: efflux RND transporter periplasmic adaptor subunit [Fusobacteriaceae bacterium]
MKSFFYAILMSTLILSGCGGKVEEEKASPAKDVVTTEIKIKEIIDQYDGSAVAVPKNKIDHIMDTTGTIIKLYKKNGDLVKKGDLIITLKDSATEAEYLSAKASLESAKSTFSTTKNNFGKYQILYEKQLISESEYLDYKNRNTDSQGDYLAKKARFADAKDNFDKLKRVALTDGVVGNLFVKIGNDVKKGDLLFTVIDETEIEVSVDFPGKWFSSITLGGEATVEVSDLGGKIFKGYIKEINPVADIETKKYKVKLGVPNIDSSIKDGMYIKATVPAGKRNTLVVPEKSVFVRALLSYVYLEENGVAKRVEVISGTINSPMIEISSVEIKEGDKVVVDGIFGLNDGDKIKEKLEK